MNEENSISLGIPLHCIVRAPFLTVNDLKSSIGVVRKTPLFRIDPEDNKRFSESTYLNVVYPHSSSNSIYEDDLVEGFYLISLMDALKKCTYHDDESYYGLNYGSNKLRFIEKVFLTDVLVFQCSILSVTPKGENFLVETNCELWVEGAERPAVVYSLIYILLPAATLESR